MYKLSGHQLVKNMNNIPFGTGAFPSENDPRAYIHENSYDKADIIPPTHSITYKPDEVKHQRKIGICTSESLIQLAEKHFGRKFSDDFQYLAQKKEYDRNWGEGSSLQSALWVAKNIGLLPQEKLARILDLYPEINYEEYVARLQSITNDEYLRLKNEASKYKIVGFARVDTSNKDSIAKAMIDSKVGLYTRYEVTTDWYTDIYGFVTWAFDKISPLRRKGTFLSGHAISATAYDFTSSEKYGLTNTWGTEYGRQGYVEAINSITQMKEAWIVYWDKVPENVKPTRVIYQFKNDLKYGQTSDEIKFLQLFLIQKGLLKEGLATGYYGALTTKAVLAYQKSKKLFFTSGKIVGISTRYFINQETK